MKQWKWFVYIVECKDGLYYTGMTWNLDERIEQHRVGKGSKFTAKHGFKALRYFEEFSDIFEARRREHQLKDLAELKSRLCGETVLSQRLRTINRCVLL